MNFTQLLAGLPPSRRALIQPLHEIAMAHGCACRMYENEIGKMLAYSLRKYQIKFDAEHLRLCGEYDNRAFFRLYHGTSDDTVRKLLFDAAIPCCYCINDKCTTLLMEQQRTIEYGGKTKKLCGPYRHWLELPVTADTLPACRTIAEMMFEHTYPHMHKDLFEDNQVTYSLTEKNEFYILGYMARHHALSREDGEHVKAVLADKARLNALLEAAGRSDTGRYVGAVDKFENGNDYEFLFGIAADRKPNTLPDGAVCRKVRGGRWAVYNSPAGDYRSIWKSYTADFYKKEHMGYDPARIPFEYYDTEGRFSDVHIPVDEDMPQDSARTTTMLFMPVLRAAGFPIMSETDHPLYVDYPFDIEKRLADAFPNADRFLGIALHAFMGKPIRHGVFYAYDDLTDVPDDTTRCTLPAGWFLVERWRHFNGGVCDYPFNRPMNFRRAVDDAHHPGLWLDIRYPRARGGYTELCNPAIIEAERRFETVELAPQRIIGKLEAPPDSVVTDEEKEAFYTLPENSEKGTYMIGYTLFWHEKSGPYFDKPLVKGVPARPGTPVPPGYQEFTLEGGRYIRVTTDGVPNGEPGWDVEWLPGSLMEKTGHQADMGRQFIIRQKDYGRSYDLYIPY